MPTGSERLCAEFPEPRDQSSRAFCETSLGVGTYVELLVQRFIGLKAGLVSRASYLKREEGPAARHVAKIDLRAPGPLPR